MVYDRPRRVVVLEKNTFKVIFIDNDFVKEKAFVLVLVDILDRHSQSQGDASGLSQLF